MNKLKLTAGVLLILLTGIVAGHLGTVFYFKNKIYHHGPPEIAQIIKENIGRELKLTREQQIEFEKIFEQSEKDFQAFRQKHNPEVERIFSSHFQQINEILTPEQKKQFEKIKNRFKRRFQGPKGFPPHRPFRGMVFSLPGELKERLNLSEEQMRHIAPMMRKFNQNAKAILSNDNGDIKGQDPGEKIKQLEDDLTAQISPYLDDKQIMEFRELIRNRRSHHPN